MKKTIYYVDIDKRYIMGDKVLRIAFIITNVVELALIIYLLVRC